MNWEDINKNLMEISGDVKVIRANQEAMASACRATHKFTDDRILKLEHQINGNGKPGILDILQDYAKDVQDVLKDFNWIKWLLLPVASAIGALTMFIVQYAIHAPK